MKHDWKLVETTKDWYYCSQNKDGSWNKTPVTVDRMVSKAVIISTNFSKMESLYTQSRLVWS